MDRQFPIERATFGLTGGIGSGKSTVSERFSDLGAEIIDADEIVRELQEPGQLGYLAMISVLGEKVLDDSGRLDRKKAAGEIFSDPEKRRKVEALIHPLVAQLIEFELAKPATRELTILDIPLMKRERAYGVLGIIVVDTSVETATSRLVSGRNFSQKEAQTRIGQQIGRQERLEMADFVIDNNGGLDDLNFEIGRAWNWMQSLIHSGRQHDKH